MPTRINTQDLYQSCVSGAKMNVLTTKGDILVYDTAHNRLPVTTDGSYLVTDSTATSGLRWATPTALTGIISANTSIPTGNTIVNTSAETAFTSTATIPANTMIAGYAFRIKASGVMTTYSLASGTLTLKVKIGSTILATLNTGLTGGLTNTGWNSSLDVVVFSAGTSGTADCQGIAFLPVVNYTMGDGAYKNYSNTSLISINTTVSNTISMTATLSTANASSGITLRQLIVSTA